MSHVTLVYSAVAVNQAASALEAALLALPTDPNITSELGLVLDSNTGGATGNVVTRTIVYHTTTGAPIAPANLPETLANLYTRAWSRALITPVTAAPVVVTP